MSDHFMPQNIEAPTPVMFWDPLEFVIAVALIGFGIVANAWIPGLVAGMSVLMGARYLKRGARRGAAQHVLWALGLQLDPSLRRFPPAWVNDFSE